MRDQPMQDQELPECDLLSIASRIRAHTQAGDLRVARDLARTIEDRPTNQCAVLQAVAEAFETSLDFATAGKMAIRRLSLMETPSVAKSELENRVTLLAELNACAMSLGYSKEALLAVAEYFVQSIRERGNVIYSVELSGTTRRLMLLDFGIDGVVCTPIFYELMSKLVKHFGGRCAHELVPCDVHSYFEYEGNPLDADEDEDPDAEDDDGDSKKTE